MGTAYDLCLFCAIMLLLSALGRISQPAEHIALIPGDHIFSEADMPWKAPVSHLLVERRTTKPTDPKNFGQSHEAVMSRTPTPHGTGFNAPDIRLRAALICRAHIARRTLELIDRLQHSCVA